jgi:L-lactate dehydrogenase complex protein LldE
MSSGAARPQATAPVDHDAGGGQAPAAMPSRAALFLTCVSDLTSPGPARAAVEVLEAMGVAVAFPRAQTCCGQPALNSGYPGEARALAKRWIRIFQPYEAVVAASGSCVATVHHQYPRILEDGWRRAAQDLARRTFEFSQFVAAYGHDLRLALDATVTYHDSCHMLRSLHESRAPREVLGRIEGLTVREMTDPDTCCGFGGTFATKLPEVSVAMGDQKLVQAHATGTQHLVSADPGCLLHLESRSRARGHRVRTRHIAELVAEALAAGRVPA